MDYLLDAHCLLEIDSWMMDLRESASSHSPRVALYKKIMKRISKDSFYASKRDGYYSIKYFQVFEKENSIVVDYIIEEDSIYCEKAGWGICFEQDCDTPITQWQYKRWGEEVKNKKMDIAEFCKQNAYPLNGSLKVGDYIFKVFPAKEDEYHSYDEESYISRVTSAEGNKFEVVTEVFNNVIALQIAETIDEYTEIDTITKLNNVQVISKDVVNAVKEKIRIFIQQLMNEIDDELLRN